MNKYKCITALMLAGLSGFSFASTNESNLKIKEVGAWAQGNSIFYIKFDREVGPSNCRHKTIKVYLGKDTDSQNDLMAMSTIRSMALTALTADLNVRIRIPDTCVHGHPGLETMHLSR